MREEHLFGIHLYPATPRADIGSGDREIGNVYSGEFLVMEGSDGAISVCEVATGHRFPLNRDRKATEGFLASFAEYLSSGPAAPTPVTMTAEQAAERLRAFREGQIRPPLLSAAQGTLPPHTAEKAPKAAKRHRSDRNRTGLMVVGHHRRGGERPTLRASECDSEWTHYGISERSLVRTHQFIAATVVKGVQSITSCKSLGSSHR